MGGRHPSLPLMIKIRAVIGKNAQIDRTIWTGHVEGSTSGRQNTWQTPSKSNQPPCSDLHIERTSADSGIPQQQNFCMAQLGITCTINPHRHLHEQLLRHQDLFQFFPLQVHLKTCADISDFVRQLSALSMNPLWMSAFEAMQNVWEDTLVGSMELLRICHRVVNSQSHSSSHWHPGGVHQNEDTAIAVLLRKVPCQNTPHVSRAPANPDADCPSCHELY